MEQSRIALLILVCVVAACGAPTEEPTPEPAAEVVVAPDPLPLVATANFTGREGSDILGSLTFIEEEDGVHVTGGVANAPAGTHGFHLHEIGDCSAEDFTSAGGHFNPTGVDHGGPDAEVHHAGDFGNIEVGEDGKGEFHLTSTDISLGDGPDSVIGRGVILHADADDLTSQPTGAAGARLACGVVEIQRPSAATEPAEGDAATEG